MTPVPRFPVVLFDLDGTVVDSGAIILASMRHATQQVLGREYADPELMQAVGGPGRCVPFGGSVRSAPVLIAEMQVSGS